MTKKINYINQFFSESSYDVPRELSAASFSDVVDDTRELKHGDLFLCRVKDQPRVVDLLNEAKAKGAVAALLDKQVSCELPQIIFEDITTAEEEIVAQLYGSYDSVSLTGITGTDGKTSVSMMLAQAIAAVDGDCGISGTIEIGSICHREGARLTTPSNIALKRWLSNLTGSGCQRAAMEVSSHALSQKRVKGLAFSVAALTNLGRDHLDYHSSIEEYHQAKGRLFEDYSADAIVYFSDDEDAVSLLKNVPDDKRWPIVKSLVSDKDLVVESQNIPGGLEVGINTRGGAIKNKLPLVGDFQSKNVAMVAQIMRAQGFKLDEIQQGLEAIKPIPGRMQIIQHDSVAPMVIVDYSHTPGAIANALLALRATAQSVSGKLTVVFGCGGDRDPGKRGLMAGAAEKNADKVYLTSDNPRTESPEKIIAEATKGFKNPDVVVCEVDRRKAISLAIQKASKTDVILIAGKGHETYQEINGQRYPFSDSEVALSAIEEYWG